MRSLFTNILCLFLAGQAYAGSQTLSYSGRITDNQGTPASGPLDMTLKFFNAKVGGKQLGPSKVISGVTTNQGVFQIEIELSESEINSVFGTAGNVWVEASTGTAVFPRQSFNAVPYAFRVPVSSSLKFNSQGELEVDTKNIDLTNNSSPIKISSESGNGSVILEASGSSALTLKMPPDLGTANYVLKTDGAGNLSWAVDAVAGPGAVNSLAITDDAIEDVDVNSGANINASKLGTGAIDNTEFNTLDGVSSSIQTQLNGKVTKGGDTGALTLGTNDANNLTLEANGSPVVTVNPSGNVGIGSATPGAKLDVNGPLDVNGHLRTKAGSGGTLTAFEADGTRRNRFIAGADVNGAYIDSTWSTGGTSDLTLKAAGVPTMTIKGSGDVGIGTTSPDGKLHVFGGAVLGNTNSSTTWADHVVVNSDSSTAWEGGLLIQNAPIPGAGNTAVKISSAFSSGSADLRVGLVDEGTPNTFIKDFIYADGVTGNVGIGTTIPANALDVVGNGISTRAAESTVYNGINTYTTSTNGSPHVALYRSRGDSFGAEAAVENGDFLGNITFRGHDGTGFISSGSADIRATALETFSPAAQGASLSFYTTAVGTTTKGPRMTIGDTGNVGIGVTNPAAPLDIDGHMRSSPSPSGFGSRYTGLDISQGAGTNRYLLLAQKGVQTHTINGEIVGRRQQNSGVGEYSLRAYVQVITNSSLDTHTYWQIDSHGATPTIVELTYGGNQWIALDAVNTATFSLLQHAQFTGQFSNQTDQLTWVDAPSVSGILPVTSSRNFTLAGKVGIGTSFPNSELTVEGVASLKEQTSAPADVATYGKLYTKTDGKLYFKSDDTGEVDLTSGGSSTTGVNGSATLASDFSITAANGVPQNTGLGVTLPSAGTYLVTADVCAQITFTSGPYGVISADLYDTTASLQVTDSETSVVLEQATSTGDLGCSSISKLVTVGISSTIELRAFRQGGTVWSVSDIKSNANGKTRLTYVKLSN